MTAAVSQPNAYEKQRGAVEVVARLQRDPHAPFSAMIEIADRCNEVCVHCYQVQGQKGEMTTEQLYTVLDDLANMGVLFLTLSGGEPTLRKDFLDIVRYARKKKFAIKIFSNGININEELARALGELAVQEVQLSLYSHRPSVHDWVTRVPGSHEKTVQAARYLIANGVRVVIKTPLMSFNADEYDPYIEYVSSLGASFMFDPVMNDRENGDRDPESLRMAHASHLKVLQDKRFAPKSPVIHRKQLDTKPCGACSGHIHIEANGEMRPCALLTIPTGSAVQGVRNAWEQDQAGQFIRHLTWGDIHGCRDCDLRDYCSRCFANSLTQSGDALGPYESACKRAKLKYQAHHGAEPTFVVEESNTTRRPEVGPYKQTSPGVFQVIEDQLTEDDLERRRAHAWVQAHETMEAPTEFHARPGDLVQIRRPGRSKSNWERIPASRE